MKQMQLVTVAPSKSGKSLMVSAADGGKYFAKIDSGLHAGMTIEAETEVSSFQGRDSTWIGKYKVLGNQQAPQTIQVSAPAQTSGQTAETLVRPNIAPWWMAFVSNTIGNGMRSGVIDSPEKIAAFARAAHRVAVDLANEPDF